MDREKAAWRLLAAARKLGEEDERKTWPTPEEIGHITARLALADEEFLAYMLVATEKAGDRMLPADLSALRYWARQMRVLQERPQRDCSKN